MEMSLLACPWHSNQCLICAIPHPAHPAPLILCPSGQLLFPSLPLTASDPLALVPSLSLAFMSSPEFSPLHARPSSLSPMALLLSTHHLPLAWEPHFLTSF